MRHFKVSPFDDPIYEYTCALCEDVFESEEVLVPQALCQDCDESLCPCAWCSTLTMVNIMCQECGHYTTSRLCSCAACTFNQAVRALNTGEDAQWHAA